MNELIQLEMKKLCRRKMTIVVTGICFFATALFFLLPFLQYRTLDENGTVLSGSEAVSYRKECFENISGTLTEERIAADLKEYQDIYHTPGNLITERGGEVSFKDEIYYSYLAPRTSYLNMLGNTYNHNAMGYLNIPDISTEDAGNFYQIRNKNVNLSIENNPSLSSLEKDYWKNKNAEIDEPYEYGYPLGWTMFIDTAQMLILCILGICIAVAPVFSNEYQSGTDTVILSTKYGKSKVIYAKIISSLLFGTVTFVMNCTIALLLPLLTFGVEGGNLPLQIMDSYCPYALNFSQAAFIVIGIAYFVMLGLLAITLLCSSKMKSAFTVLIIDVLLIFLPVFFSYGENSLWQHIYPLLPYPSLTGFSLFKEYLSYGLGGIVYNVNEIILLLYLFIVLISLPLAYRNFKRHQVQ